MMMFVVFCVSDIMENSKMNDAVCCFLYFRHYGELKDERCCLLFFVFQTLWRTQSWMMMSVVFCVSDIMENSKMNDAVCCFVLFLCFRHYGELKDERCCLLFLCFRHYGELKAG